MQTKTNPAGPEQDVTAGEPGVSGTEPESMDAEELSREETLQWLMELDRDEPEENVFIVARGSATDFSLSAQEAAVAARPMIRGRAGADDLSTYVGEEIVLGEPGSNMGGSADDEMADAVDDHSADFDALMAVDFSREVNDAEEGLLDVEEGSDILGLEENDDIGEHYLVVKRVKRNQEEDASAPVAAAEVSGQAPVPQPAFEARGDEQHPGEQAAEAAELPLVEMELAEAEPLQVESPLQEQTEELLVAAAPELEEAQLQIDTGETALEALEYGVEELELVAEDSGSGAEQPLLDIEEEAYGLEELELSVGLVELEPVEPEAEDEESELGLQAAELEVEEAEPRSIEEIEPSAAEAASAETARESASGEAPEETFDFSFDEELDLVALASDLDEIGELAEEASAGDLVVELAAAEDKPGEFEVSEATLAELEEIEAIDLDVVEAATEPRDFDDLHEDLREVVEAGSIHTLLTPRLPGLMSELDAALAARLTALSRPGVAIDADVSIAETAADIEVAEAEGYAPMATVCSVMPEALADLDSRHIAAVYLRLRDSSSGELYNRIFHEDAAAAGPDDLALIGSESREEEAPLAEMAEDAAVADDSDSGAQSTAEELRLPGTGAGLRLVETRIFDEDLLENEETLEEQLRAAPEGAEWTPDSDEIDAIFSNLDSVGSLDEEFDDLPAITAPVEALADEEVFEAAGAGGDTEDDMSWCIPEEITFSQCSPSGGEIFDEFLDAFIEEGSSELEKLEAAIGSWESDRDNPEHQAEVGRVLHTIKGIAKGVGLHYFGTLIHNFETLLEELPKAGLAGGGDYFRIVNAWLDAVVRGIDFVQQQRRDIDRELPGQALVVAQSLAAEPLEEAEIPVAEAVTAVPEVSAETAAAPAKAPVMPEHTPDLEEVRRREEDKKLADEGARVLAAQQSVRITSEKLDLLLNLTNQAQQLGVRTTQTSSRSKRATAELQGRLTSVRAHIADIASGALFNVSATGENSREDLDALEMDRYSELQEAANILREGVEDLADLIELVSRHNGQAEALLKQQATVISSIGSSIRAARVVPVSRLSPGLRRLVRTVSADLGKEVAFRVLNEVGTLDRDDYARCQTILEHMVRNALDHGVESASERQAAGKPSVGQITLDLRKSGADTIFVLSDDGRGMDPAKIREAARSKGVGGDVYALTDEEALKLVFQKGFSTASEVSQISGRGVGMDIVASELQKMGGEVRITSEIGKGTSFHIRIPTSVAVNGALLVSAGDNYYAIPLGGLIAVDEVPVDKFFAAVEEGESLVISGLDCEPAYLGTLCQAGNLPERSAWRHTVPVLVAGSDERRMAIAVDDVEEALELVIRTLGAQFAAVPGVAGAATTADGEAVVALDLNVLVSSLGEGEGAVVSIDQPREEKLLALVVDDSRTQRMVATSQLESAGLETATAENGAVAIDWLNTTERLPDIVLLDVEMPVKDGIQALREIRKSPRFSEIPVIMITSRTGIKHRTLAEEAGCNGYMGKPFNFRMLMGQINELTGHRLELESQEA